MKPVYLSRLWCGVQVVSHPPGGIAKTYLGRTQAEKARLKLPEPDRFRVLQIKVKSTVAYIATKESLEEAKMSLEKFLVEERESFRKSIDLEMNK